MIKIECNACKANIIILKDSQRFSNTSINLALEALGNIGFIFELIDGWFIEIGEKNTIFCPNCRK